MLTKGILIEQYSDVFQGTGKFDEQYHATIDPDATLVVHPPRPVPIVLKDDLKAELERLESEGILKVVTEPALGFRIWSLLKNQLASYVYV